MNKGTVCRSVGGGLVAAILLALTVGCGSPSGEGGSAQKVAQEGAKAETPKQALVHFSEAVDSGDVNRMLSCALYDNEPDARTACTVTRDMRRIEVALDESYGPSESGYSPFTGGPSFFTLEQLESDAVRIEQDGNEAKANVDNSFFDGTVLVKEGEAWYIDLRDEGESAVSRKKTLRIMEQFSDAMEQAREEIGQPGKNREDIETELFSALMAASWTELEPH